MDIQTISSNIDDNLEKLEKELLSRQEQLQHCQDAESIKALEKDIDALNTVKKKLITSKDIAWRAHNLRQESEHHMSRSRFGIILWLLAFISIFLLGYVAINLIVH